MTNPSDNDKPASAAPVDAHRLRDDLTQTLRDVQVAAKEVLGPKAWVSLTVTVGDDVETVWEVGVQTKEHTRDLWGRGPSVMVALQEADTSKRGRGLVRTGGRR